jgi:BA14K-like protein
MRAITRLVATTFVVLASGAFALALLLSVMSGAALAQITGTVNPSGAPAESSAKEDVPPGGCMPIGLTASGEIVFPIQCRELIERQRGKAVEQKPAAVEEKPVAVEEKPAAKQSEDVAPVNSQPIIKPVEAVPLPKHKPRERAVSRGGCQHFQTYDPASGTYTGYDGQRHSCR